MGFKIINSREYREVCERVAFLESDIDGKNRDLELKDETIKRLKKEIVQIEGCLAETKASLKELQSSYDAMFNEFNELKAAKPQVIEFAPETEKVEAEKAAMATVKKPRARRKPSQKKDNK